MAAGGSDVVRVGETGSKYVRSRRRLFKWELPLQDAREGDWISYVLEGKRVVAKAYSYDPIYKRLFFRAGRERDLPRGCVVFFQNDAAGWVIGALRASSSLRVKVLSDAEAVAERL